jgi:type IV pilus assembly protein PilM
VEEWLAVGFLERLGFKKITELVGIDIGTSSIKVCLLKETPNGFKILGVGIRGYGEEIVNEGYILDKSFVASEIKSLLAEKGIKCKTVACALSSYVVIAKVVTLPFLEPAELDQNISYEVENAIPFPIKDVYYSYYVLGTEEGRDDRLSVQIAAAKKEIVDGFIETFQQAGLSLQLIDVDIFGITNLVEQIYAPKETSVLIVDIGASTTNMAILREESIQFTREILLGGRSLTSLMEKALHLPFEEAEQRKAEGIAEAANLFDDFIYNVSSEINKTINFYVSIKPKESISRIYLTGGAALLRGLPEQIKQDTKTEVEYLDPFKLIGDESEAALYAEHRSFIPIALYLSSRVGDLTP